MFSGQKLKNLLLCNFFIAHFLLGLLSFGFLFFSLGSLFLIVGIFLYFLFTAFGDSCWWPFIQPQIPQNKVSTFFARLRITWATFGFVGVLVLKYVVDDLETTREFAFFIFIINFVGFLRVFFLLPLDTDAEFSRDNRVRRKDLSKIIKKVLKLNEIKFIYFFLCLSLFFFGSVLVLFLNDRGVPKGENFIIQGIGLLSTVVSLLFVNHKLKNKNQKYILERFKLAFFLLVLILPIFSLINNVKFIIPLIMLLKFFAGVFSAGAHLIYINQLFSFVDKSNRAISMSLLNLSIFGIFFISEFLFSIMLKLSKSFGGGYFQVFLLYSIFGMIIFSLGNKIKNYE